MLQPSVASWVAQLYLVKKLRCSEAPNSKSLKYFMKLERIFIHSLYTNILFLFPQIGAVFVWSYVYNIVRAYREEGDVNIKTVVQEQYGGASTDFPESSREELLSNDSPSFKDREASSDILLKRPENTVGVVPFFL